MERVSISHLIAAPIVEVLTKNRNQLEIIA